MQDITVFEVVTVPACNSASCNSAWVVAILYGSKIESVLGSVVVVKVVVVIVVVVIPIVVVFLVSIESS